MGNLPSGRRRRRGERNRARVKAQVETDRQAAIDRRNQSAQFGGAVPGRAPASEGGPPRILQNLGTSLLSGGTGFDPLFQFPTRRR